MSDMTRTNTEPSAEALEAAAAVLPITWGKQLVRDVALALDRFRAAGVREERERIAAHIDCLRDCRYANASGTCQRTDEICSHHVAESIRAGEAP